MTKQDLEKMRDEAAPNYPEWSEHSCAGDDFKDGFNYCIEILWPRLVGLSEANKMSVQAFSCIRHNCPVDAMYAALDVSVPIVMEHIDVAEKLSRDAIEEHGVSNE